MQMFPWQEPEVKREQSLNKDGRRRPTELWGISVITQTRLWLGAGPCRCCSTFVRFAPRIAGHLEYITHIHATNQKEVSQGIVCVHARVRVRVHAHAWS